MTQPLGEHSSPDAPDRSPAGVSPRRRKRRGRGLICLRDGCRRGRAGGQRYCTLVCRRLSDELSAAQRLAEAIGPNEATAKLRTAAIEAADAWTAYTQLSDDLRSTAHSVGLSDEQWAALAYGIG